MRRMSRILASPTAVPSGRMTACVLPRPKIIRVSASKMGPASF